MFTDRVPWREIDVEWLDDGGRMNLQWALLIPPRWDYASNSVDPALLSYIRPFFYGKTPSTHFPFVQQLLRDRSVIKRHRPSSNTPFKTYAVRTGDLSWFETACVPYDLPTPRYPYLSKMTRGVRWYGNPPIAMDCIERLCFDDPEMHFDVSLGNQPWRYVRSLNVSGVEGTLSLTLFPSLVELQFCGTQLRLVGDPSPHLTTLMIEGDGECFQGTFPQLQTIQWYHPHRWESFLERHRNTLREVTMSFAWDPTVSTWTPPPTLTFPQVERLQLTNFQWCSEIHHTFPKLLTFHYEGPWFDDLSSLTVDEAYFHFRGQQPLLSEVRTWLSRCHCSVMQGVFSWGIGRNRKTKQWSYQQGQFLIHS